MPFNLPLLLLFLIVGGVLVKTSRAVAVALAIAGFVCSSYVVVVYMFWALEGKRGANYFAGLEKAQSSAPVLAQFRKVFPGAQVNYRYFDATGALVLRPTSICTVAMS